MDNVHLCKRCFCLVTIKMHEPKSGPQIAGESLNGCNLVHALLAKLVRTIALNTIERVEMTKGTVRDVKELNTRLGIWQVESYRTKSRTTKKRRRRRYLTNAHQLLVALLTNARHDVESWQFHKTSNFESYLFIYCFVSSNRKLVLCRICLGWIKIMVEIQSNQATIAVYVGHLTFNQEC